jgi:hypothetical protein
MSPQAAADKPAGTFGWPSSPARLFGIATAFLVVTETILRLAGFLGTHLPVVRDGQITQVQTGALWLLVAAPFAIFALIYAGIELKTGRVFEQSPTRIHFVCTLFAVLEAIRVYLSWASTTASPMPAEIAFKDLGGVGAFLSLAITAFIWNLVASKPKSAVSR